MSSTYQGPTWYVEEEEGEPSPRGAVHEVWSKNKEANLHETKFGYLAHMQG